MQTFPANLHPEICRKGAAGQMWTGKEELTNELRDRKQFYFNLLKLFCRNIIRFA